MNNYEEFIEWRPVVINGIITLYEVSNKGQVRNKITKNILRQQINSINSYPYVSISFQGYNITRSIHRIVAFTFIPNDDPIHKTQVNHINGIKYDNRVENLEWCTRSENEKHAYRTGLKQVGENNHLAKYENNQIHLVCKLLEQKIPMKVISVILGVNYSVIRHIKHGRDWKHISQYYNLNFKFKHKTIKYNKLKSILINLNMFDRGYLINLLYSEYIRNKKQLLEDLKNLGYEIFIDSILIREFKRDYKNKDEDDD